MAECAQVCVRGGELAWVGLCLNRSVGNTRLRFCIWIRDGAGSGEEWLALTAWGSEHWSLECWIWALIRRLSSGGLSDALSLKTSGTHVSVLCYSLPEHGGGSTQVMVGKWLPHRSGIVVRGQLGCWYGSTPGLLFSTLQDYQCQS